MSSSGAPEMPSVQVQIKNTFIDTVEMQPKPRVLRKHNTDPDQPTSRGLPLLQLPEPSYEGSDVDTAEPLDAKDIGCGSSDPGSSIVCSTPESTPRHAQSPSPWTTPATPEMTGYVPYDYAWAAQDWQYTGYQYAVEYAWTPPPPTVPVTSTIMLRAETVLGIDVELLTIGNQAALRVVRVLPLGSVEALNRSHFASKNSTGRNSDRTLVPGDLIVAVNSSNTLHGMVSELHSKKLLQIFVSRLAPEAASEWTAASAGFIRLG